MRLRSLALFGCLLAALPASADPLPRIPCQVDYVVDADTIQATCRPWPGLVTEARVRVLGIDTPERSWRAACEDEAVLAEIATREAEELLRGAILLHVDGRDSFGRILAHVELPDGRDYGEEMVRRGLALPYEDRAEGWCG